MLQPPNSFSLPYADSHRRGAGSKLELCLRASEACGRMARGSLVMLIWPTVTESPQRAPGAKVMALPTRSLWSSGGRRVSQDTGTIQRDKCVRKEPKNIHVT